MPKLLPFRCYCCSPGLTLAWPRGPADPPVCHLGQPGRAPPSRRSGDRMLWSQAFTECPSKLQSAWKGIGIRSVPNGVNNSRLQYRLSRGLTQNIFHPKIYFYHLSETLDSRAQEQLLACSGSHGRSAPRLVACGARGTAPGRTLLVSLRRLSVSLLSEEPQMQNTPCGFFWLRLLLVQGSVKSNMVRSSMCCSIRETRGKEASPPGCGQVALGTRRWHCAGPITVSLSFIHPPGFRVTGSLRTVPSVPGQFDQSRNFSLISVYTSSYSACLSSCS